MERKVYCPQWIFRGVRMLMPGFEPRGIAGVDVETIRGRPYTAQIWTPDRQVFQVFKRPAAITPWILRVMGTFETETAFYAHNLTFDIFCLFYRFQKAFLHSHFRLKGQGLDVEVFYGNVTYASVRIGARRYMLLDTFAFFKTSLARLADMFGLPEKLKAPKGLGEREYKGREMVTFRAYAMRDPEIAWGVGKRIEDFHREYDIPQTVSAPQMSARILRKHYIPEGERIPCPPKACIEACQYSYHGGKNGLYVAPGIYHKVRVYDINSAYPFSYTLLPNFLSCAYLWRKGPPRAGQHGVVCVSGEASANLYNPLRDHRFAKVEGTFTRLWITTYEYQLLRQKCFVRDLKVHETWEVVPRARVQNPLMDFARDFYVRKSDAQGVMREFYKIVLNSLYGKFIQNIRDQEQDLIFTQDETIAKADEEYIAGGLYNPMVATLITGFVRAYLTAIELKSHSLHSSTDSVITQKRLPESKALGGLSLKAVGSCLLLRPKLYVVWNRDREVTHFALHGFHGYLGQLLALVRSGKRSYSHRRMLKVRESDRDDKTPLTMETFYKRINLPFEGPMDIPRLTWQGRTV